MTLHGRHDLSPKFRARRYCRCPSCRARRITIYNIQQAICSWPVDAGKKLRDNAVVLDALANVNGEQ